jgi:hypothetical protein
MRLRWVIPAKWVELDGDGDAIITNAGVDAIYVWEFPAPARVILGINVCRPSMARTSNVSMRGSFHFLT